MLTVAEADLTPPADATAARPRKVSVSAGLMQGNLISQPAPQYPKDAREAHITGTVVLQATVDREGNIANLKVISGPSALQEAAVNVVQRWRYKPYLLNGAPVEVETQINVVFGMGVR